MARRSPGVFSARWAQIALLVVSGIVSLAILELGSRWLHLSNVGTPYVREDPDTVYAHIPGKRGRMESPGEFAVRFVINSKGLRSPEIDYARSERRRVLAMGDSFTFGVGAEDDATWPAVLNDILNRSAGPNASFETVNAGVQGWGLAEYWVWLEKEGTRYRPDTIIIGVHASDWEGPIRDFVTLNEAGELQKNRVERSGLSRLKKTSAGIPFYETLMNWSVFANFLKTKLAQRLRGGTTQSVGPGAQESAAERFERSWPTTRAILLALEQNAHELGARLVLVFIPTWQYVRGEGGHAGVEGTFREALENHANEHALPFVDMASRFRDATSEGDPTIGDLFHLADGHNTPTGYVWIAEAAAELLGPGADGSPLDPQP